MKKRIQLLFDELKTVWKVLRHKPAILPDERGYIKINGYVVLLERIK